ncbi:MAG: hypothetical protein JSU88_04405, partial [Nitrospinaceae bacterium]
MKMLEKPSPLKPEERRRGSAENFSARGEKERAESKKISCFRAAVFESFSAVVFVHKRIKIYEF